MRKPAAEHTLEYLLDYDGRVHWLEQGFRLEFRIARVSPDARRPHGLRYAFTLHDTDGKRIVGFDNAHAVSTKGSRFGRRPVAADHWHRDANDIGRPYAFTDAETLLKDFFAEVRRALAERGMSEKVVKVEEQGK